LKTSDLIVGFLAEVALAGVPRKTDPTFLQAKAKERYSPSRDPRNRYRNLELLQIFYDFSREVLAKRMKESQFEEFRKNWEQKRSACRSRVKP